MEKRLWPWSRLILKRYKAFLRNFEEMSQKEIDFGVDLNHSEDPRRISG